jgi:outer membrane lipoprotein-sorting protein
VKKALAIAALFFLQTVCAYAGDVDTILKEIDDFRSGVDSFACDFSQTKRIALFKDEIHSTGSLAYKRPETIILRYDKPDDSVVSVGSGVVTMYYPSLREAKVIHFNTSRPLSSMVPLLIGAGEDAGALKKAYSISYASEGGLIVLTFIPKTGSGLKGVEKYVFTLTNRYIPVETTIYETEGDSTTMKFRNQRINSSLDEKDLKPVLPPGTRIEEIREGDQLPF